MNDFRTRGSTGRHVESLKLPGDFERRSDRERRELRERWARGEGFGPPALSRIQNKVSSTAQQPRYRKSRGAGALEDALAKFPPIEPFEDEAAPQRPDATNPAHHENPASAPKKEAGLNPIERPYLDSDDECVGREDSPFNVESALGVRVPKVVFQPRTDLEDLGHDSESNDSGTSISESDSEIAEYSHAIAGAENLTSSRVTTEIEAKVAPIAESITERYNDARNHQDGAEFETYKGYGFEVTNDYVDSFSAFDGRYTHYYDNYDAHEDYEVQERREEIVQAMNDVSQEPFVALAEQGEPYYSKGRDPVIRRVASSIDEDGYVIPELKEASNVYLTLMASEDAPVSRVDFSTPVTEAAISLVTSRLPRITDEMVEGVQTQDALGTLDVAAAEGTEVLETNVSGQKKPRSDRLKNVDRLTASTLVLMIGNVLSKLTGQLRQVLYPHVFVEKHLTDAYVQGFLIPDFIYELLIGGSIQAVIVPTLAEALGTEEEQKTWKSISKFISFVSLVMLGFLLLAELLTPQILMPFVKPENIELTTRMARALFPQTFFMMCAAMVIGLINAHRRFLKTTFGPAIYNTLFVLSIYIFGAPNEDALVRVGLGVSFSALVYFLFQLTMGREEVKPFKFSIDMKDKGFQRLLILVVPILFSSSISHINTMVLHGFTKDLEAGAATALNQTNSVWLLPYGIFSVAIGQAMLPTLSSLIGRKQEKGASDVLSMSLRRMLYFAIPSALSFYLLRDDLMQGIYIWRFEGYSEQIEVTRLAAELLRFYCLSILFQSIIYIYNYAFYAMKITYLPLINGVISLVLTLVVGSYTTRPDVLGAAGLSVSYALSGFVTALMLIILYRLRFPNLAPRFFSRDWGIFFLKLIPMTVISCSALLAMERYIVLDLTAQKLPQLLWLGLRFIVVFGLWYLLSKLLRLDLGSKKGREAVAAI